MRSYWILDLRVQGKATRSAGVEYVIAEKSRDFRMRNTTT